MREWILSIVEMFGTATKQNHTEILKYQPQISIYGIDSLAILE